MLCVGGGGLGGHVALILARKGIGRLTILDDDIVEPSNLNRQRFYAADAGRAKALALVQNLRTECTYRTDLRGYAMRVEDAAAADVDLQCDVAVCGVDNNPTRIFTAREFRRRHIPVIFLAVSAQADHGYVFVQEPSGTCIGCIWPDSVTDARYPCPGTPAMADIVFLTASIASYAVDTLIGERPRTWNYRAAHLVDASWDRAMVVEPRQDCCLSEHSVSARRSY